MACMTTMVKAYMQTPSQRKNFLRCTCSALLPYDGRWPPCEGVAGHHAVPGRRFGLGGGCGSHKVP